MEALEGQMQAPGFWDDAEVAAKVSAEHAKATKRLQTFTALESDVDDLDLLAEMAGEEPSLEEEVHEHLASVEERLAELEEQRLFSGRYDVGDALVSVNAGAGGTDAQDWAEMVLRMMMRWAERGVHRLVRLSPFDSAHRRHTSFAGVEVAPVVEDTGEVEIDEDDLQVDTYRASGAGGQHVNKTDSAVRITHRPSGIVVQCQNERSQTSNRATAMAMLRSKLVEKQERERKEEIAREKGEAQDVNFGSQIRSYVLHPYSMAKDHRTGHEMGDVQRVLDGDLDGFVRAHLLKSASHA